MMSARAIRGSSYVLSGAVALDALYYVKLGIEADRAWNGNSPPTRTTEWVRELDSVGRQIATEIEMFVSEHALRTSPPPEAKSPPSTDRDLPQLLTVRQVVDQGLLRWCEGHIRLLIRTGKIPTAQREPIYMLERAVVLAIAASHAEKRGVAA